MAHVELDAIDRRILSILQENGRLSNQDIAERVNLSPSPCLRRIRRLEEMGVITGYVALLDPQKLGLDLLAYVSVRLEKRGGGGGRGGRPGGLARRRGGGDDRRIAVVEQRLHARQIVVVHVDRAHLMRIRAELAAEPRREVLLQEREREHVVQQPDVRVVRAHERDHVQPAFAQQQLQAERARHVDVAPVQFLVGAEDLQHDALALGVVARQDVERALDLVEPALAVMQQARAVAGAGQMLAVRTVARHRRCVVRDEFEIVAPGQIPQRLGVVEDDVLLARRMPAKARARIVDPCAVADDFALRVPARRAPVFVRAADVPERREVELAETRIAQHVSLVRRNGRSRLRSRPDRSGRR